MNYAPPLRTLTVVGRKPPLLFRSFTAPRLRIDGFELAQGWDARAYAIAADRPVHVECYMAWIGDYGKTAVILPPGTDYALEYAPPVSVWYPGEIGPVGSTRNRGIVLVSVVLGFVGLVILAPVAFVLGLALS